MWLLLYDVSLKSKVMVNSVGVFSDSGGFVMQ